MTSTARPAPWRVSQTAPTIASPPLLVVGHQVGGVQALPGPDVLDEHRIRAVAVRAGAMQRRATVSPSRPPPGLGSDLTPLAEPRSSARLHTDGQYRFSRNPLYAGLLPAAAGVAALRRRRRAPCRRRGRCRWCAM